MNAGLSSARRWDAGAIAALALAVAVVFSFGFTPLRSSHDEFWHIKTGSWIAENGRLPEHDIFTYTAADLPWDNHEWLIQYVMWRVWSAAESAGWGGWRAVILLKTLCLVLAFAGLGILIGCRMRHPAWAALTIALTAALGRRSFFPRPPFVTYAMLALLIGMLLEWRAGRLRARALWLLVPLFALWANLHGGWMAGLVVLGAFWAEALLSLGADRLTGMGERESRNRLGRLTAVGAACVAGTLLNPAGWRLYALPGRVLSDPYLARAINEMLPPEWKFVWVLFGTIILLLVAALRPVTPRGFLVASLLALALALALWSASDAAPWIARRQSPLLPQAIAPLQLALAMPVFLMVAWRADLPGRTALFLLLAFFGWQGLFHIRHLTLFAIVALPALAANLDGWAVALEMHRRGRSAGTGGLQRFAARWMALVALVPLACFWFFSRREGGVSHVDRNLMLARGVEFQPVYRWRDPAKSLPAATTLPYYGIFEVSPYPVAAVNFFLAAHLPGRLWNGGNYAGYLIWRLSPEKFRVFTDNRYDVFGARVIRDEHSVLEGWDEAYLEWVRRHDPEEAARRRTWRQVLDHWRAQTLFLPTDAPVNAWLAADRGWVRVYEDFDWILWVRDTPANRPAIDRALDLPRPLPWLRVRQWMPLSANPAALTTMGDALKQFSGATGATVTHAVRSPTESARRALR